MMKFSEYMTFMKENYPLVKIVEFDECSLLCYDARANMMFVIHNDDFQVLTDYLRLGNLKQLKALHPKVKGLEEITKRVDDLQKKGVLLPGPAEKLISSEDEDVRARIQYNLQNIFMRKFVLETTQQCNFRCRYCHNTLETVFRHHSKSQMSCKVAETAIDFYMRQYLRFYNRLPKEKKELMLQHFEPTIGFYGGEPTLNWNLVEKAVDYYYNLGWENYGIPLDKLAVSINTNLYILTDKMLSFILKYRPQLYVSLDGPKEDNDRNRITADGHGTFDQVYANIRKIQKADQLFFENKLMVLCVEAEGNNRDSVHEMLDSMGCMVEYMPFQPYGCAVSEPEKEIQYYDDNEERLIAKAMEKYKKRRSENDSNALDVFTPLFFLENMETDTPCERRKLSVNLTCPLCVDNIMIGTNGEMHICHKTDGSLPLGNVCGGGYDMRKMMYAYKSYAEATNCDECRSCWAMNNCSFCAAIRLKGGKWVNPKHNECDLQRRRVEFLFKLFVEAYKYDPDFVPKLMERKHNMDLYKSVLDYNDFIRR